MFSAVDPTQLLCVRCGLCCDGSLLDDIELQNESEADSVEAMGLEVEDDTEGPPVMTTPCRALKDCRCSLYPYRPLACRSFECRLLLEVRAGKVPVEEAFGIIGKARQSPEENWVRPRFLWED